MSTTKTEQLRDYAQHNNAGTIIPRHEPPSKQQARVNVWNRKHAIGTEVEVRLDDGTTKRTVTTSDACLLSGHTAVIMLKGISGCYMLSRVTAV